MTEPAPNPLWAGRTLALLGILLVALNLRTAVAALSPIVDEIDADIGLPVAVVGILGMLPPVCFAVFGILTPVFTRRIRLEPLMVIALFAMGAGHLVRGLAPNTLVLVLASTLAFAGLGVGNVLLPPLVKKYFPDRVGLLTSVYVTILALSTLVPPLVSVPIADSISWRLSLGIWAALTVVAIVPWVSLIIRHRTGPGEGHLEEADSSLVGRVWHSSVAWGLAAVFAVSSLNAYALFAWLPTLLVDEAGSTPAEAGALLALYAGIGLPGGIIVPWLAVRMRRVDPLVYVGVAFFLSGYLGLLLAPATLTWLWVALAGLGPMLFPLALVLINLRTRTHAGSVALSGFTQGVGYSVGALGPLVVGLLHEASGGWTIPVIFLAGSTVVAVLAGTIVGRPHMLEDSGRTSDEPV
ncbi:MAG: MFS transporter [Leifsonia sp.]